MRTLLTLILFGLLAAGAAGQDKKGPSLAQLQKDLAQTGDVERRVQAAMGLADLGPRAEPAIPALLATLESTNEDLRLNGAIALGKIGKPAVAPLAKLLDSDNKEVRFYAIWALGWVGPDASDVAPRLVKAMADKDMNIRRKAAYALGRIAAEPAKTLKVLLAAFKDSDEDVRQAASDAVAKFGIEAVPGLITALQDKDALVRMQAAHAVTEMGTEAKDTAPVLRELLLGKDESQAYLFAQALAKLGKTGVPALVAGFKDDRPNVRQASMQGLQQVGADAVPALVDSLGDKKVEVRRMAAQVLAPLRVGDKMVVTALAYAVKNDSDDIVRQQCVQALQALGISGKLAVPALQHALADSNNQVRMQAFYALQGMGENPREGLLKALASKDDRIRINTAALMLQIGVEPNNALPVLVDALKHDNGEMRMQAAHALAQSRRETEKLLPFFQEGLKNKTAHVRIQALQGLAMLGNQSNVAVQGVIGGLTDDDANVRQQALQTLQSIPGNADTVLPVLGKLLKDDKKAGLRAGIVQVLWRYGPKAMPLLLEAFKDGDTGVRQQASWAMMNVQGDLSQYVDGLAVLLKDKDLQTRYNLINLLGRGGEKGAEQLGTMLRDPDTNIRMQAAATLRNVGKHVQKVVPALTEAVQDKNVNVRIHAAYALAQAGDAGVAALTKAFEASKDGDARAQIIQAMIYSPSRAQAAPLIKQAVKDGNRNVRIMAIQLLPNLGQTQEVADILTDALKDKELDVRVTAAHGLQNFGVKGMPTLEKQLPFAKEWQMRQALLQAMINYNHRSKAMVAPLTAYLKDGQPQVRWQAAQVLGNIGPDAADAVPMLRELLNDSNITVRQQALAAINRIEPQKK